MRGRERLKRTFEMRAEGMKTISESRKVSPKEMLGFWAELRAHLRFPTMNLM